MLEYRVNINNADKSMMNFPVETVSFTDFSEIVIDDETGKKYDGVNKDKIMLTCECTDIGNIKEGSIINTLNTLTIEYGTYDFNKRYQVSGVNVDNRSFSIFVDKYYTLIPHAIVKNADFGVPDYFEGNVDELRGVTLYFEDNHYFDETDNTINEYDTETDEIVIKQEIPIYFKYTDNNGEERVSTVKFRYFSYNTLITEVSSFDDDLYFKIFSNPKTETFEYQIEGNLGGIEIYRDNFLFGDRTVFYFQYDKSIVNIPISLTKSFETNIYSSEALQQEYVREEKVKAINSITDLEKDVYYPVIRVNNEFSDIYTIKFNMHFREHRGDDWLVDGNSYWNGVNSNLTINHNVTDDNVSDLLTFLGFTNKDVRYQKSKLKKSFLRLLYYDSTNPGDQNLLGYSTVFFDTGDMFAKYAKYMNRDSYITINYDKETYGDYSNIDMNVIKTGIKVNRETVINHISSFEDDKRLGSQFVIKSKNTSKASSEGFYIYMWRDNESPLPQDLYMKVEFNHAGYGRTIPFMMPYWDREKWNNRSGIKTFEQILNDWKGASGTDGKYGIRQYNKFSYIHLKYQYDKDNNKHIYYLDTDTYGNIDFPTDESGNKYIEINLYEAKVE
jgi:hypothetical protein